MKCDYFAPQAEIRVAMNHCANDVGHIIRDNPKSFEMIFDFYPPHKSIEQVPRNRLVPKVSKI